MLSTIRHDEVFDSNSFGNTRIDVIGAGSVGSKVILSLVKLGISNINVWDADVVESHNISNQAFSMQHIGMPKVEAIKSLCAEMARIDININNKFLEDSEPLGSYVFLLTDSMSSRKNIWEKCLKFKPNVQYVIETRMEAAGGRLYSFNPMSLSHGQEWQKTLYTDEVVKEVEEVSACRSKTTVGPTAEILANLAVWSFIRKVSGKEPENEVILSLDPFVLMTRNFKAV